MIPPSTHTAYIALGSNIGDRPALLAQALTLLDEHQHIHLCQVSTTIETAPVGGPPGQPAFLNAAAELATHLPPTDLLAVMIDIENQLGRRRDQHWGPRTIDLDLLLYDHTVLDEPQLKLPHPLMHKRTFVMIPLAQIAPHAWHPLLQKTAQQILDDLC